MTKIAEPSRPLRLVGQLGGAAGPRDCWPPAPLWLSEGQREEFLALCARLDDEGMLAHADLGDITALAVALDNLRQATLSVNLNGKYVQVVKQQRPYQCPACKGSGVRPLPKGRPDIPVPPVAPALPGKLGHRPCSVCTSPQRAEIDAALGRGDSLARITKANGTTPQALIRHKRNHLGKPPRPVLVDPRDTTCQGCGGRGVIIPELRETTEKRPEVTDQRYAIEQVANLSAKMGLDVTSRTRVKGKFKEHEGPSALKELLSRRAAR
jgi:phage terminase small subunit